MSDTTLATDELQRQIEMNAGAVIIGPDADAVRFTLNGNTYPLNYLSITAGGFTSAEDARLEAMRLVMAREFVVLGNPIRLQRVWPSGPAGSSPAAAGYPQGAILVWRKGHEPSMTVANNVWSVSFAYAVLPAFAQVEGTTK